MVPVAAVVKGTRFLVTVKRDSNSVRVDEGRVLVQSAESGTSVMVGAGAVATVESSGNGSIRLSNSTVTVPPPAIKPLQGLTTEPAATAESGADGATDSVGNTAGGAVAGSTGGMQVVTVASSTEAVVHAEEITKAAAFAQERAEREARLQRPLFVMPTKGVFTSGFGYRWGVLHGGIDIAALQVAYDDDGRTRPILHRASISEMVVPYGDTSPTHYRIAPVCTCSGGRRPRCSMWAPRSICAGGSASTSTAPTRAPA